MGRTRGWGGLAGESGRGVPVLARVASMSVAPGLISPRFSAPTIIESAGRSLTEPAGLLPSSLARIALVLSPGMRCRRTNGVLPTNWSSVECMCIKKKPRARRGFGAERRSILRLLRVLFLLLLVGF